MYLLYLDESGVEQVGAGPSHFVLLGLAVPADEWKLLDGEIEAAKSRYELAGEEIHTAWMARRYREQEAIPNFDAMSRRARRLSVQEEIKRRSGIVGVRGNLEKMKAYRREIRGISPYLHLSRVERKNCLVELSSLIGGAGNVRLFADAIRKADFNWKGKKTPYEIAFEQIISRFDMMLENFQAKGLMIADNNDTAAPRLTRLCRTFHESGTFYRNIHNIIETPLFVNSYLTTMIQMADLSVYALRRYLENGEAELWKNLEPRVDRAGGRYVGVRHFTGKRPCDCAICSAHGRNTV